MGENEESRRACHELIGRAEGILMARRMVDTRQARELLARASQGDVVRLREIAARIVISHEEAVRHHREIGAVCADANVVLTEREKSVLRLLARRLSYREISEALFISVNTTKTHVGNAYLKLGVTNRLDAIAAASAAGLLQADDQPERRGVAESDDL